MFLIQFQNNYNYFPRLVTLVIQEYVVELVLDAQTLTRVMPACVLLEGLVKIVKRR